MDSTQVSKKVIKIGDLVEWKYNSVRLAIVLKVYDDGFCDVQWLNFQGGLQVKMHMDNLLHVGEPNPIREYTNEMRKESRLYGNR